jgi:hypothetical protein
MRTKLILGAPVKYVLITSMEDSIKKEIWLSLWKLVRWSIWHSKNKVLWRQINELTVWEIRLD